MAEFQEEISLNLDGRSVSLAENGNYWLVVKADSGISVIDKEISNWNTGPKIYISHIGLIVALDYLNFRKIFNWKNKYSNISGWHDNLKNKLPGYFETYPSD